jgi:hypothetical protein
MNFIVVTKIMKRLNFELKSAGYLKVFKGKIGLKSLKNAISSTNLINNFAFMVATVVKIE